MSSSTPPPFTFKSPMPLKIAKGLESAPLEPLIGKTIAVIGFGNQGRAHALNLRDSGLRVVIGGRADGKGLHLARELGFPAESIEAAASQADLLIIALPDEVQDVVYVNQVESHLKPDAIIGFLHGFSIRFGHITPHPRHGVIMIAPKGPGTTLRERFVQGLGIPCLFALHQDSVRHDAEAIALAWAHGIGCARAGVIYTTFEHETDTDLFGEQSVLCGGMTHLILAAFETLTNAGYPPELAYLECCHEVKQIADLVYERGIAEMMEQISNTAEFGAYATGTKLVDEHVRATMRELLDHIRDGSFARDLKRDHAAGFPWFKAQRRAVQDHPIESAGRMIRALMPKPPVADDKP